MVMGSETGLKTEETEIGATMGRPCFLDCRISAKPFYRTNKELKVCFLRMGMLVLRPIPNILDLTFLIIAKFHVCK